MAIALGVGVSYVRETDNVKGRWNSAFIDLYGNDQVEKDSVIHKLQVGFDKVVGLYNGSSLGRNEKSVNSNVKNSNLNSKLIENSSNFKQTKKQMEELYSKYNYDFSYEEQSARILKNAASSNKSGNFEFSEQEIGIYVEQSLAPSVQIAVKKYDEFIKTNPSLTEGWPPIKVSVKSNAFEGVDTFNNLDYLHQNTPDIVFYPLDRVPQLVNDYKSLMPLNVKLINKFMPTEGDLNTKNREALLTSKNEKGDVEIYGLISNDEALLQFERGQLEGDTLLQKNQSAVEGDLDENANPAGYSFKNNKFFRFDMKNSWYSTSIISGFLFQGKNLELEENTANQVGRLFLSNDEVGYTETEKKALQSANQFIYQMYNGSTSEERSKNFMGDASKFVQDGMFPPNGTETSDLKALTIEGSWMFSTFKKFYEQAGRAAPFTIKKVDDITNNIKFVQQPGGWAYGINKRNSNSSKRVEGMYKFMEIIMTNKEAIISNFETGSKIVKGVKAYEILNAEYPSILTNGSLSLERQLLEATWGSSRLSGRVDQGLPEYNAAFGAFDGEGWATMVYSPANAPDSRIQRKYGV